MVIEKAQATKKPVIALFIGDPAGIGPELTSKLLSAPDTFVHGDVLLIGHHAGFDNTGTAKIHHWSGLNDAAFERAVVSARNGAFMLNALTEGVRLVKAGKADALCFAPLNKGALRAGGMHHEDEMG